MTNHEEENTADGAAAERIESGRSEVKETDPMARLEAIRTGALGGTRTARERAVADAAVRIESGVDSVKGTAEDKARLKQEVGPVQAEMGQTVVETEQRVERVMAGTTAAEHDVAERDKQRMELQEAAYEKVRELWKSVLQDAKLWEGDHDSSEQQKALQPAVEELGRSGNLFDYLALKSMTKRSMGFDAVRAAMQDDPATLERARKEILTAAQNVELDTRLERVAKDARERLNERANSEGITVARLLAEKPTFLNQGQRNALEFVKGKERGTGDAESKESKADVQAALERAMLDENAAWQETERLQSNLQRFDSETRMSAGQPGWDERQVLRHGILKPVHEARDNALALSAKTAEIKQKLIELEETA